jgi:dihydroorotase-like cyclic amidohydrolase
MVEDGACGFKAFLVPSGVDEFPHVGEADLRAALPLLAERGVPLLAHAEIEQPGEAPRGERHLYSTYLATRPPSWENEAVRPAWGGIASLQLRLPVVWTGAQERGFSIEEMAPWLCERPAKLAGFGERKGRIEAGRDADLVVWNPEATFEVRPEALHHRHTLTPYAGHRLLGVVEATYLRGTLVWESGAFASPPAGTLLQR